MSSSRKKESSKYPNKDNRSSVQRPSGVLAFATFFIILAVLGIIEGIAILLSSIPFMEFSLQIEKISFFNYINFLGEGGIDLIFFGGRSLSTLEANILLSRVLTMFFFFLGGLGLPAGMGLLKMRKWGRYLGLIFGAFLIFGIFLPIPIIVKFSSVDTFPLVSLTSFMAIILIPPGVLTLAYLMGDLKYEFKRMDVNTLISDLKYGDRSVRKRAAGALRLKGESRAVEPLIVALRDEDWKVQENAKKSLMKIGKPAVEALIQELGSYDPGVRFNAIEILGEIGDERAVEPLIQILGDMDWEFRENAAWALGIIGNSRAVEPLSSLLNDSQVKVQKAAKIALYSIAKTDLFRFKIKAVEQIKERAKKYKDMGGFDRITTQYLEEQKIAKATEEEKRKKILAVKKARGQIETGVLSLGIFFLFLAVLSIIGIILIVTEAITQQYVELSLNIWQYFWVLNIPGDPEFIKEIMSFEVYYAIRGFDVLTFLALSYLIIVVMAVPSSIGLLRVKKWGYYLGLVFGVVLIIISLSIIIYPSFVIEEFRIYSSVASIFFFSSIFLSILGVITILHLVGDVKYEFES